MKVISSKSIICKNHLDLDSQPAVNCNLLKANNAGGGGGAVAHLPEPAGAPGGSFLGLDKSTNERKLQYFLPSADCLACIPPWGPQGTTLKLLKIMCWQIIYKDMRK